MKNYTVKSTGHNYDFARYIENLTDHTLYFTLDENNTDVEYDEYGNYVDGKTVYRECDRDEAEYSSDSFSIRPHDWIGLFCNEVVW